jgi:hypothetical protein
MFEQSFHVAASDVESGSHHSTIGGQTAILITNAKETTMRFVCLGYIDEQAWNRMSKTEQDTLMKDCAAYDEVLRQNGHWVGGGLALQSARTARTLRRAGGQVQVTDGPFAETKEQLGGIGFLEARDMEQAVDLMSKHPGVGFGPFEIRALDPAGCGQPRS